MDDAKISAESMGIHYICENPHENLVFGGFCIDSEISLTHRLENPQLAFFHGGTVEEHDLGTLSLDTPVAR